MQRKRLFRFVVIIVVGVVAAYLWLCWLLSAIYLSPGRSEAGPAPAGLQDAAFESGGFRVPAWVSPNVETASLVYVLAHGYGGNRARWEPEMRSLERAGFGSIAPAMPGQDASPEPRVGFGITEARTLVDAVKWVRAHHHGPVKIVLMGVSMGGAACWLASEKDPSVDGIITEGAYAEFPAAMSQFFNRRIPLGAILLRPVIWMTTWRSGVKPADIMPVRAAAKWLGRPALVIQAGADDLILRHQANELEKASGAQFWMVPGASHANASGTDPIGYERRTLEFGQSLVMRGAP